MKKQLLSVLKSVLLVFFLSGTVSAENFKFKLGNPINVVVCRSSTAGAKMRVCQNVHILFLCTKPRLSQARALLFPKVFVPLGTKKISL